MNCICERLNTVSLCPLPAIARPPRRGGRVCDSAANLTNLPLRRVGIIATAIALVMLTLIPPAGGQELQRLPLDSTSSLGTMDWQILQTPFFLQAGQKVTRITLHIVINGKGTVWVDDVVLFKKPLH